MARDDFNPQDAFAKLIGHLPAEWDQDAAAPAALRSQRAVLLHAAVRGELSMALKGWKPKE